MEPDFRTKDFVLLWGAESIARELGVPTRKCFHLLESGALRPAAKKFGGGWVAERSSLRALFLQEEACRGDDSSPVGMARGSMPIARSATDQLSNDAETADDDGDPRVIKVYNQGDYLGHISVNRLIRAVAPDGTEIGTFRTEEEARDAVVLHAETGRSAT